MIGILEGILCPELFHDLYVKLQRGRNARKAMDRFSPDSALYGNEYYMTVCSDVLIFRISHTMNEIFDSFDLLYAHNIRILTYMNPPYTHCTSAFIFISSRKLGIIRSCLYAINFASHLLHITNFIQIA